MPETEIIAFRKAYDDYMDSVTEADTPEEDLAVTEGETAIPLKKIDDKAWEDIHTQFNALSIEDQTVILTATDEHELESEIQSKLFIGIGDIARQTEILSKIYQSNKKDNEDLVAELFLTEENADTRAKIIANLLAQGNEELANILCFHLLCKNREEFAAMLWSENLSPEQGRSIILAVHKIGKEKQNGLVEGLKSALGFCFSFGALPSPDIGLSTFVVAGGIAGISSLATTATLSAATMALSIVAVAIPLFIAVIYLLYKAISFARDLVRGDSIVPEKVNEYHQQPPENKVAFAYNQINLFKQREQDHLIKPFLDQIDPKEVVAILQEKGAIFAASYVNQLSPEQNQRKFAILQQMAHDYKEKPESIYCLAEILKGMPPQDRIECFRKMPEMLKERELIKELTIIHPTLVSALRMAGAQPSQAVPNAKAAASFSSPTPTKPEPESEAPSPNVAVGM